MQRATGDLRNARSRQPHVLVGGLGAGKTAVLVRMTELLAQRGAVPVPVRLRDVEDEIDFLELARRRFATVMTYRLRSAHQIDRVWHELLRDDRIVVLADGLEEAFADAGHYDRDHRVRVAVTSVGSSFPLIIASRPHDALRALEAARVNIEPLAEEAVLESIAADTGNADDPRLHWLVQTAGVTDAPLYLKIARELGAKGLLGYESIEVRGADRVHLRLTLIGRWLDALVTGNLAETERVPLGEVQRLAALAHLEALASIGLRYDTQQINLNVHWVTPSDFMSAQRELAAAAPRLKAANHELAVAETRLAEVQSSPDATTLGGDRTDRDEAGAADQIAIAAAAVTAASTRVGNARELQGMAAENDRAAETRLGDEIAARDARVACRLRLHIEDRLTSLNRDAGAAEVLDMQAAASRCIQLGLVDHLASGVRFPHSIVQAYLGSRVIGIALGDEDPGYLINGLRNPGREFLLALVIYARQPNDEPTRAAANVGEILKQLDAAESQGHLHETKLLEVLSATVDVATAIALRGSPEKDDAPRPTDAVVRAAGRLSQRWSDVTAHDDAAVAAKLDAIARLADSGRLFSKGDDTGAAETIYQYLYFVARQEDQYAVRLAAAQAIGSAGDVACRALRGAFPIPKQMDWKAALRNPSPEPAEITMPKPETDGDAYGPYTARRLTLRGWLLPMLLGSAVDSDCRKEVRESLRDWVSRVGGDDAMPLQLEAALAQGFKHAANRRPIAGHDDADARVDLQKLAGVMIRNARFWYTRITLLHALCLWELGWDELTTQAGREPGGGLRTPADKVERWLRRSPDRPDEKRRRPARGEHPFVAQAAYLVTSALEKRQPERFIWIDESGIVGKIGSRAPHVDRRIRRALWIPPSAGWVGLNREAQQLVADVQILLNLADRGGAAADREERLEKTNRGKLPVCLTGKRCEHLRPSQTVGMADIPHPGFDCPHGCMVNLCPYPPRGQQEHQAELSEAFCRQQAALVKGLHRRARWQQAPSVELRWFWAQMEDRARK